MAEYIDREKINLFGFYDAGDYSQAMRCIKSLPTANVIERSEYENVLKENKQLKHIISDRVDKDLKCAFEVKELRSKIDKAIDEMNSIELGLVMDCDDMRDYCVEILKEI